MFVNIPYDSTQEQFENRINEIGIENITDLTVEFCKNITNIIFLSNLKLLDCTFSSIISISPMEKLEWLRCDNCPNLLEIPYFPSLLILDCKWTKIRSIPLMEKLEQLVCYDCPDLIEIPNFPNLKAIMCDFTVRMKFYSKNLIINCERDTLQHLQGRLFQNTYRTYELLIF